MSDTKVRWDLPTLQKKIGIAAPIMDTFLVFPIDCKS